MSDRNRPPMKNAVSAGALIESLLRQRGFEGKLREYRAWQVWDEVVGPQIAARARPSRIRDGVLEVRVDQPVWMQQLQLMKPKILARLNERLEGAIRDIYLRRGRNEPQTAEPPPALPAWRAQPLTEEESAAIEAALACIHDPELRRSMRAILVRQKKLEKIRDES